MDESVQVSVVRLGFFMRHSHLSARLELALADYLLLLRTNFTGLHTAFYHSRSLQQGIAVGCRLAVG